MDQQQWYCMKMKLIMMDVMCDTMCVERTRFEEESIRGQMQSTYYSIRFAGNKAQYSVCLPYYYRAYTCVS